MMDDAQLIESFEAATLTPADFDHATHIRVTWVYLRREPLVVALEKVSSGLRRLTQRLGIPGKYHETITWAYVFAINERMQASDTPDTWDDFAASNADLLERGKAALKPYYSDDALGSELARRTFVLPDMLSG
jgi:hypothetical protein